MAGGEAGREEKESAREKLRGAGVKNVLCMFSDLRGILQSFAIPAEEFIEGDAFEGIGFDGSSIRGLSLIHI